MLVNYKQPSHAVECMFIIKILIIIQLKILPRFDWSLQCDVFSVITDVKCSPQNILFQFPAATTEEIHNADIRQDPHWQDDYP